MLFVGPRAEVTVALWGSVFAISVAALVVCAAKLWKRYRYFS
jgi:hypothetical protein